MPRGTYDEYVQRGESENRNLELKDGLHADRLSDQRFVANIFRLFLHAAALNQFVRLRRATRNSPTSAELRIFDNVPAAALPTKSKPRYFHRRRRHDPLGEGPPRTGRSRLIQVAVEMIGSSRRVLAKCSSSEAASRSPAAVDVASHVTPFGPDNPHHTPWGRVTARATRKPRRNSGYVNNPG